MAQPTKNANALAFAADITNFSAQLRSLLALGQSIQDRQTNLGYAATLQAMATYTVNTDGTAGAADASPNQANPITGLNSTFYNLDQARTALVNDLVSMLTGSAAVTTTDRRPKILAILG